MLFLEVPYNITLGAYEISYDEIIDSFINPSSNYIRSQVLFEIRIPRVILALLVGIAFGISGAIMQTLFKNPLADPSIIGVSAGATAGVVVYMLFASVLSSYFVSNVFFYLAMPFSAFLGAISTIYLIYKLANVYNKISTTIMLLAGIAINALLGALVGVFTYLSSDEELRSFTFWTMGSLANADFLTILILLPIISSIYFVSIYKQKELNLILLGDDEASNTGLDTVKLKKLLIFFVALSIGFCVAFCGIIAFVGLVVPHIARSLVGSDHKYLLHLSALLGAFILL